MDHKYCDYDRVRTVTIYDSNRERQEKKCIMIFDFKYKFTIRRYDNTREITTESLNFDGKDWLMMSKRFCVTLFHI